MADMRYVNEKGVDESLHLLIDTAEEYAQVRAAVRAYQYTLKTIESEKFLQVEKGSIEFKKAQARSSQDFKDAVENYREMEERYGELEERRETARLIISLYQSRLKAQTMGGM